MVLIHSQLSRVKVDRAQIEHVHLEQSATQPVIFTHID
jgi:hypothetical protein